MNNAFRSYHLERAAWWQKMAREAYDYGIADYLLAEHRTYWQHDAAICSQRAMMHLRDAGVLSDDD